MTFDVEVAVKSSAPRKGARRARHAYADDSHSAVRTPAEASPAEPGGEKEQARRRFLAANGDATSEDFERLWLALRDRRMIAAYERRRPCETKGRMKR
jgi:sugar lactone lactonase YvrE